MVNIEDIKKFFRGGIALHEPLSKYTSFRIGGPADYFLEPADKDDVIHLVRYLQQQQISFIVVGRGSNLLVSDDGIRGAVVSFEHGLNSLQTKNGLVLAEAGVSMARFVDFCVQHELRGVEMLPGIPGTLGGAIVMNAGAYGGEVSDHLVEVEVLREGSIMHVKKGDAGFAYRTSGFQRDIVLSATFSMPHGEKEKIAKIRHDLLTRRNQSQPLNFPNSGSMFKNPPGTFAAKLIEDAGLKGTQQGKAKISEKHANFIVNLGGATANDVLDLVLIARNVVYEKFNIKLDLEVKLVGFAESVYKKVQE